MTAKELREKFKKYFVDRGHKFIPSASLIPENDPTVLFTTAGMHPLVPYLLGEKHPEGKKLCNIQRCIRTGDIDQVGDESHLTFFEMIGYWSLGAYWKKEAIELIFKFLTKELGLDPKKFAISCFQGDPEKNIPRDEESAKIWQSLGIPEERIKYLGYEDNWWGPAGETGPCGPDSELFVWTGKSEAPAEFDPKDKGWMELCNDVFMEYNKKRVIRVPEDYDVGQLKFEPNESTAKIVFDPKVSKPETSFQFTPLSQKNVDFGMGFERLLAYLNDESDIYKNELFWPIIEKIEEISGKKYDTQITLIDLKNTRKIADHLKAAVLIISEGIAPSNKDRGYVVRRLIRTAIVAAYKMGVFSNFCHQVTETVFSLYPQIKNRDFVSQEIIKEENKFRPLLESGLRKIEIISSTTIGFLGKMGKIGSQPLAKEIFDLYQSNGFPVELSTYELKKKRVPIGNDIIDSVDEMIEHHRELSRTASAGMFKGGLADDGEQTTKYHTTAHLMLVALKQVLGNHVEQKGANINAERLRFDFSHSEKMTDEQKQQVEDIVNKQIEKNLPVKMQEMSHDEAKLSGAHGTFNDRYGERVKVYTIGDASKGEIFSKEICGGPHVERTGVLGHFRIKKEESSSAGIRRIKAILEQ